MFPIEIRTKSSEQAVQALRHIDHVTYVARAENERSFLSSWERLGFREHTRLITKRYPASHIALVTGQGEGQPWVMMTGLSVSVDPVSPINEFVRRYGEGMQHVAYSVDPGADMDALRARLERAGWHFMTPVLTYGDEGGARLRQLFAAPTRPYGTFTELIQRLPGPNGAAFDGFDPINIDDLYEAYADVSAWLARPARARWGR